MPPVWDGLEDFLQARIDEDQKRAYTEADAESGPIPWHAARVAADGQLKKRLLEMHCPVRGLRVQHPICACCGDPESGQWVQVRWPCATIRALAMSHISHPDFREEWRS